MYVAAIDIGAPDKGKLGWWVQGQRSDGTHSLDIGGTDVDEMISTICQAAKLGPVALGFEAPMYVPAGRALRCALRQRPGEGRRTWSASAGATVCASSLAIVPTVLRELAGAIPGITGWQDWHRLPSAPRQLLVFEAFVSGGKSLGHADDARRAVGAAHDRLRDNSPASDLGAEECFSVLGAALLRTGLSTDVGELSRPCLVVKALRQE